MKYMLLIHTPEWMDGSDAQRDTSDDIAGHIELARDALARGAYVTCDALNVASTATTVRVRNGGTVVTRGPFAETREVLGGFYIFDCKDLDEAIAYAERIPPARRGSIEIRPILEIPGWDEAIGLAPDGAAAGVGAA